MSLALPAQALLPDVQERILKNGLRVLAVERPGTQAIHVQLFLRGGSSECGSLPPLAATLLARSFDGPLPGKAWSELEPLLKQEEGAYEALRLARLQRDRSGSAESSPEGQALEILQQRAFTRIRDLAREARLLDPLDSLGVVNRSVRAEADYITWGADVPKKALGAWCAYQAEALKNPKVPWFPLERDRMLQEIERGAAGSPSSLSVLLGTALTGRAYAQVLDVSQPALEALTWSDLLAYARREVNPERLLLVLVGDFKLPLIAQELDDRLGALPSATENHHRFGFSEDLPVPPGARRLQANTARDRRLLMAWRVPPMSHPDTPLLQILARILGGGRSSRLIRTVVAEKRLAKSLTVRMGVPGGRQTALLLVEAVPETEHALGELEQVIQGEIMRFQQEGISEDEIRRAQRWEEAEQLFVQEDASTLATAIGASQCEGGNWRLAFRALQLAKDFSSEDIRRVARRYLVPAQITTALLEPDPILNPLDRQESRMVRVLTQLLASKLQDPAQAEAVIRETLRQVRMLPSGEQEKMLKLLEARVKP